MLRRLILVLLPLTLSACGSSHATPVPHALPIGSFSRTATAAASSTPSAVASSSSTPQPGARLRNGSSTPSPAAGRASNGAPAAARTTTAPGTYTYDTSGTTTFGAPGATSTLTVDPPSAGRQHTSLSNDKTGTTDQLVAQTSTGTAVLDLKIGSPVDKEFVFSPPALLFPSPATVGRSWSWSAASTDGKSTVHATNKVARTERLTIGGTSVLTAVLQTHLVITGDVSYTADVTTWVATAYRLPVKDHTVGHGTLGTLGSFDTDITDVMRSVVPS